jgi:hypothetical protein
VQLVTQAKAMRNDNVVWTFEQERKVANARRRLFEGSQRLLAQEKRVFALSARGRPAADARHLLATFADSQIAIYAAQSARRRAD